MATLTVQAPTLDGAAISYASAAGGGDTFANDGMTLFHAKNGSGGAITVTAASTTPCNQGHDHDAVVSVPAGGDRLIGPFPIAQFSTEVSMAYSGVTSLTVAALSGAP